MKTFGLVLTDCENVDIEGSAVSESGSMLTSASGVKVSKINFLKTGEDLTCH